MNARDAAQLCNQVARTATVLGTTSDGALALLWTLVEYTYSLGLTEGCGLLAKRVSEDIARADAKAAIDRAKHEAGH